MQRRNFITTAGAVGAVGMTALAGCLGDDDEPDDTDDTDDTDDDVDEDAFPTDSLTWMIPWSEGGGTDQYARQLQPLAEEPLGQSIQIDNREGAGSMLGSEWLTEQDPDGYTFGTINSAGAHFTWRAAEIDDWHIEEDFEPISYAGVFGYTLIVNDQYGIEDFGGLRDAYADGEITGFGYQGVGSDSHLATLLLRENYDLEYDTAVPYDGGGPTQEAVISDEVGAGFATNTSAVAAEESGEASAIVNLTEMDLDDTFPGIDPITNYGDSMAWLTEFWQTQLAPSGTPEDVRWEISEAVEYAVEHENSQEWMDDTGNILEYGDVDEAGELWTGIVDEMESQVDDAIGGFDEFLAMVEEEG